MLTLILQSLWSDFKKSWLNFSILFALWTICYFTFGFSAPPASIGLGLRTCFCTSSFHKIAGTLFEIPFFLSC